MPLRVVVVAAALLLSGGVASAGLHAPQFRATLTGGGHRPVAGVPWLYVVRAVDANGRPVSGTAVVRVVVGRRVVDTVGWFGFRGTLRRSYQWSEELTDATAKLQVKIVGPGGSRTVRYGVRVLSGWTESTGKPTFRTSLRGATPRPTAGARWHFVVRAFGADGRPVRGTAVVRVLSGGRVVDTVGWFGFRGTLRRTYRWSPQLRGSDAVFQAMVVGPGGTRARGYVVRVG